MDKDLLVSGHDLVDLLIDSGMPLRVAMWVHNTDTDSWRLWVVPGPELSDKREFYRRIATVISLNRDKLPNLTVADIELMSDKHPAITALGKLMRVPRGGDVQVTDNKLNDYYLPNAVILLMELSGPSA